MQQPQAPAPQGMAGGGMVAFDEGGVASLPLRDDMYNEDSFAHGGIVGDIPRFANKGSVDYYGLSQESFDKLSPEQQQLYTDSYRNKQIMGNAGKAILTPGVIAGGLEANAGIGINNLLTPVGKALGITHPLTKDIPYHSFDEMVPEMGTYPRTPKELRALLPPTGKPPTAKPVVATPATSNVDWSGTTPAVVDNAYVNSLAPNQNGAGAAGAGGAGGAGSVGGLKSLTYTPPTDLSGEYTKLQTPVKNAQSAMDEYNKLIGVDPNKAIMEARLAKMDTSAARDEERAPWMSALRAGLGMMGGTSQNPWTNIAEGATAGLKDYGTAQEKIGAAEEKRFALSNQLGQAERAAKIAAATYGLNSEQADKARNHADQLASIVYQGNRATDISKGNYEAAKDTETNRLKQIQLNTEAAAANATAQHYRDWKDVQMDANQKSVVNMDKAEKQQQTALVSAALKDVDALIKDPNNIMNPDILAQYQKDRRLIYDRLRELTGIKGQSLDIPVGPRTKPLSAFGK
jgi:hypothetical protein